MYKIITIDMNDLKSIKQGERKKAQFMTNAQHTPGPWQVIHSEGSTFVLTGTMRGDYNICQMQNGNQTANARLIAAAPDLLEALEAIPMDCDHTWPHLDACWVCKARAAIAKATGK